MKKTLILLTAVAGCASAPARVEVSGAGADLLKLRMGPSLEYRIVMGLPDGTQLTRHECVTELGQRWCRVTLADSPAVSGYVAADYLITR